jgi:threonyl-tRNA synthetase
MRWGLISHVLMWALMAAMAWDMWLAPREVMMVPICGGER